MAFLPGLFNLLDYLVFGGMLLFSALIGVYFALWSKHKPNTTSEYLLGDRKIGLFPIAMSLSSSCLSSVIFLGFPTETYLHGTQIMMWTIAMAIASFFMAAVFIPVFYTLNIISCYEYLKLRYNNVVRTFGSGLFIIKMILHCSLQIYGPALALAQVTGLSVEVSIPAVSIICVFYTSIGGLRAVVWADTLQIFFMTVGTYIVAVLGTYKAGGFEYVWEKNKNSSRIEFFNMDFDPLVKYTFWNTVFGMAFHLLGLLFVNQAMAQRCIALPSLRKSQIAIALFVVISAIIFIPNCYSALVAYAKFSDCDPIRSRTISKPDQIIPYFLMTISKNIPALPGLFISGVFSASLSTVSTSLNSMAAVVFFDFIRPFSRHPITEEKAALAMKLIVILMGFFSVLITFSITQLGNILQMAVSFQAIPHGTLLGIFILGMLFPWANSAGALTGGLASLILVAWICIGAQIGISNNQITPMTKPLSIDGCDNVTLSKYYSYLNSSILSFEEKSKPFPLYMISYLYYTMIGTLVAVIIGLIVSFLTGPNDPKQMNGSLFPCGIKKWVGSRENVIEDIKLLNRTKD